MRSLWKKQMKKKTRIIILGIVLVLAMAMSGCGVNQKSPEGVVESLIKEYVNGSEKKVKKIRGRRSKTYPAESFGGRDSVKGNRQGSLSRSITRRSGQNCKIKIQNSDFAILQAAFQKSPFGLF